jgi:hypothetical protein
MKNPLLVVLISMMFLRVSAQDDLMKMLDNDSKSKKTTNFTTATFKTTKLINGHSVENVAAGVLDFKISHRFGYLNDNYNAFGLDNASMRIGLDYGISNRLMVGIGRCTYQKQVDAFYKFKILRQSTGYHNMPITLSAMSSVMLNTVRFADPTIKNYYTSKLFFAHQLLIGRKFSESFSFQLMPTMVHYNLVQGAKDPNNIYALGVGGRIKLNKRVSINGEYYYQIPGYQMPGTQNSAALGFDIETGGHVFQVHFTNSTGMSEQAFITQTTGVVSHGDIHFGFNISRVFTIADKRKTNKKKH